MNDQRIEDWYNGDLEDDELTDAEVQWLASAVETAVSKKVLAREGVHIFPDAKGLH